MRCRTFIVFLVVAITSWAQTEIDSATVKKLNTYQFGGVYKSAVSVNGGGVTGFAGFTYDYLLNQHWRLEAGFGYYSVGFGFDYYPWAVQREKSRFKINLRNSLFWPVSLNALFHSLGFGMTHFFKNRFNLGFDIGVSYIHIYNEWEPYDFVLDDAGDGWPVYPHMNIKFGYRFSFKYMKRKKELERGSN